MKLRIEQLANQLRHHVAPVYLISGDEVVLKQQACTQIKQHLPPALHYQTITISSANKGWEDFQHAQQNNDLFAEYNLIHLDVTAGKPGKTGAQQLVDYVQQSPSNTVLLVTTPKLDRAQLRSRWVSTLEQAGIHITLWPITLEQMPTWLQRHASELNLQITQEGLALLAEQTEGNLLAAQQEIEKLSLLHGDEQITGAQIARAISQHSQFSVYTLLDNALCGDKARVLQIIPALQQAGTEPALLLWTLVRELRLLLTLYYAQQAGERLENLWKSHQVWPQRQAGLKRILQLFALQDLQQLLLQAQHCDCQLKGYLSGDIWQALYDLYLILARGKVT